MEPPGVDLVEKLVAAHGSPESTSICRGSYGLCLCWSRNWPSGLSDPNWFALCHGNDLGVCASEQVGCVTDIVSVGGLVVWVGIDTEEVGCGDKCVVRTVDIGSPGLDMVLADE